MKPLLDKFDDVLLQGHWDIGDYCFESLNYVSQEFGRYLYIIINIGIVRKLKRRIDMES